MENKDQYIGRMLDNRYEIIEKIGVGGMAVVYKALCHRLNRYVAVKILKDDLAEDEDFRRRFHSEAQAVAMLSHPNIVTVYDTSRSSDAEYIVMELIEGITLKQYMNKRGVLSWKEALHFAMQISKALIHAHSRGIIHRDIKPHNIMILKDSSVKVADFGIAHLTSMQQSTLTQETLGSVHYISPEQAKGAHTDARTDIYSLGVVMYEMVTGRLPFEGDSAVSVAIQHISSIPLMPSEINPDIPAGFEAITMKAMNPDLNQRYQSAEKLYEDMENLRKNPDAEFSAEDIGEMEGLAADTSRSQPKSEEQTPDPETVRSIRAAEAEYAKSRRRSRNVAMFAGMFLVILFIVGVFLYLWGYWLDDMFTEPETMSVPQFTGLKLDDVLLNPAYTDYFDFIPTYDSSDEVESGYIISQSPSEGRTVIKSENKPDIKIVVSSGSEVVIMPDLVNMESRTAFLRLQKMKLVAEEDRKTSDSVTEGYVIETNPRAGEPLVPGNKVYVTVSDGPEIKYVDMPDLMGDNVELAKGKLEALNLTVGVITPVEDEHEENTVIFQSVKSGTSVPEHTKVNLNIAVSGGTPETQEDPGTGEVFTPDGPTASAPPMPSEPPDDNVIRPPDFADGN